MELLTNFLGNGAMNGDTSMFHGSLMMKSDTINNNNNIMNSITLNCNPLNEVFMNANTFKSPAMNSTTSFNGTDLNSTAMNNSTFMHGTAFTSTTLNSSTMNDISLVSAMFGCSNTLSNTVNNNNTSFTGSVSSAATELNDWTAANGQLPVVVVAKGTVFPRMRSEPNETPLSPVFYHPAPELEAATPSPSSSSISPFPLGNSMTGKRKSAPAEVTRRSTPLKPPKKYRGGSEEDREIKRCKRSLSFIAEAETDGGDGEVSSADSSSSSETSEEKSSAAEKKTTTSQRPKASVERRNKRERMRVKQINNTFVTLRNQLPNDVCSSSSAKRNAKKFSKVDTLRMAIDYIRGLRQLITDHDAMFMSAECLALLASSTSSSSPSSPPPLTPTEGHLLQHAPSSVYQHMIHGCFMRENSADSAGGSDRSGAESVGSSSSSTTDHLHGPASTSKSSASSYPSSSSSSTSSFSASSSASSASSVGISDFFPHASLASNLSEDLFDAFLADMYMTS